MKMVRAMLRPEIADAVSDGLAEAGFISMTKMNIFGRGKQKGIKIGDVHYDELPKVMMLLVVDDEDVEDVVAVMKSKAYTGNFGDGKIFITPVDGAFTVRTGQAGL
ncbi:P-II family nitrogen regulator [Chlorobaculum thiosulfatiphilum]|jgi:nitrogen regulatory protein PII 1|uniref:P-II family nitrogen regulator n=1 Tax=Chlorobaculum thiosulfatiphilum TaxID=115852 RepID=A0A5C4S8J2_CHLTI|nr:P-II family nitrogen regulator [Chlorobaculum thiosulfatiphilum]TNJ39269.1 P-II family nitrogen regulator [Chlorobaculum thiosulfatiphilum]